MVMWSIWFLNLLFGDVQVYLCMSLCGKTVDAIKRSFMAQKLTNRSPLMYITNDKHKSKNSFICDAIR